ncbi:MAG: hypothetical protein RIF36_17480 [Imperialibacter sp.]|uniref:hypothetical protein n=1 Tax=Imperialibacter sp. TaxID=2038411 RepID=UPI0032EF10B8
MREINGRYKSLTEPTIFIYELKSGGLIMCRNLSLQPYTNPLASFNWYLNRKGHG